MVDSTADQSRSGQPGKNHSPAVAADDVMRVTVLPLVLADLA